MTSYHIGLKPEIHDIEMDFIIELVINYNKRHKEFKRISGNQLIQKLADIRYKRYLRN